MSLPPHVRRLFVKLTAAGREAGVWRGADEAGSPPAKLHVIAPRREDTGRKELGFDAQSTRTVIPGEQASCIIK